MARPKNIALPLMRSLSANSDRTNKNKTAST